MYPLAVSALDSIITELHQPPAWMMEAPCSSCAVALEPARITKRKIRRNRGVIARNYYLYVKDNLKI
jgi:hypothetical protein